MNQNSFDVTSMTRAFIEFLSHYRLSPGEIERLAKHPSGAEDGLLTVTDTGIRANLNAFWWSGYNPFLVVATINLSGIPLLNRDEAVSWIKKQQHTSGYFQRTGRTVREATYYACAMLQLLQAATDEPDWARSTLVSLLQAQQQPGQSRHFAFLPKDNKGFYAELEVAFCNIASLTALGELVVDREAAVSYLQKKQEKSGVFKPGWIKQQPYSLENATFDAVRALALLQAEPIYQQACIEYVQSWQLADGGFDAISVKSPEHAILPSRLYNTALAVLTLYLLGAQPADKKACMQKMLQLWQESEGYFLNIPTDTLLPKTLLLTYLGLLAMTTLEAAQSPSENLRTLVLYGPCN